MKTNDSKVRWCQLMKESIERTQYLATGIVFGYWMTAPNPNLIRICLCIAITWLVPALPLTFLDMSSKTDSYKTNGVMPPNIKAELSAPVRDAEME